MCGDRLDVVFLGYTEFADVTVTIHSVHCFRLNAKNLCDRPNQLALVSGKHQVAVLNY